MIRQGKSLSETVKRYDDIVSDKVSPVALPKEKLKEYKKAGYTTTKAPGGKTYVLVPKTASEKVSVSKKGEIVIEHPSGLKRIKHAVPFKNLPQWLSDMRDNSTEVDALKNDKQWFFYQFYGSNSHSVYDDIDLLLDDLENGSVSGPAIADTDDLTYSEGREVFQNLEIATWPKARPYPQPQRKPGKASKTSRRKTRKRPKNAATTERERAANAQRQREYRARLKGKDLKEYQSEAKKRARKSRKATDKAKSKKSGNRGKGSKKK